MIPPPMNSNQSCVDVDLLPVGEELRDAAARDHQHQRRDERLDAQDRDEEAVPRAASDPGPSAAADRQRARTSPAW